ncbi:MAG: HNH endonuclease, partial [Rhodoglobus sp.]|nr:HNH endonuclease [Rhodoglobus sp.]
MQDAEILERVDKLRVWQQHGERAPHKPLLLLLALGRFSHDEFEIPFATVEKKLKELLEEFGPSRLRQEPALPFWHLRSDKLWEVDSGTDADADLPLGKNGKRPTVGDLRRLHAVGHFPLEVQRRLRENPRLVHEIGERVLEAHFPESLHADILDAVGLARDVVMDAVTRRRRDPAFRQKVLDAYGYRCAVCGLDMRLRNLTVGIEAAHIRWHQAGGPDEQCNGLALCSLHHKVFDLGAFTVEAGKVVVSELVNGGAECEYVLLRHQGGELRRAVRSEYAPRVEFLAWHRREV